MTTTVVSSLFIGVNNYRSVDDYIMYGFKLLRQPVNKIIYIQHELYEKYYSGETWGENTTFRYISESDIYLKEYNKYVTKFKVNSSHPEKDTKEYMYLMCNKTEFVRRAIIDNPYGSKNFVWLDFGVWHMIKNDTVFADCIKNVCDKQYDNVRISGGRKTHVEDNLNINWFFLGSIFGGDKEKLLLFCDKMKERCIEIIKTENKIYWEVNIWYEIWLQDASLFSVYPADHDASILLKY
jgi:hypothetical protein